MNRPHTFVFSALMLSAVAAMWGSGIIPAIIPAAVPAANKVGNSTKFQLAGTVAGTAAALCTDANQNTTTSGCASGGVTSLTGTANQIAVSAATGAVTISFAPSALMLTTTDYGLIKSGGSQKAGWDSGGFSLGDGGATTTTFNTVGALTSHLYTVSTTPGISGCGSGAALSSNASDEGGTLTLGTVPGTCVITFASTYTTDPKCVVSFQAGVLGTYSHDATTLTISATGLSGALDYRCAK